MSNLYHGTESLSNSGPRIWNLVPDKLKQLVDIFISLRKKLKRGSRKTAHVKLIYYMLVLFEVLSLPLFISHLGAVLQKLSYEGSFLREKAMRWSVSSALTAYFLSTFSIGIFLKNTVSFHACIRRFQNFYFNNF